jgi:hypothetical protein
VCNGILIIGVVVTKAIGKIVDIEKLSIFFHACRGFPAANGFRAHKAQLF